MGLYLLEENMSSTPIYSPGMSSVGMSSSAASNNSLSLSMSLGIGRHRKNGKKVKRLSDVIKILKYAVKTQEQASKARKNAMDALKTWSGEASDSSSKNIIGQVNQVANSQWTVDSDFSPKIHTIIARLSELKKEEDSRDKARKAVVDAEKTYYRSLYKNYPRSEVEMLERSCKNLKEKSKAMDIQFQNSTASTLSQCLSIFFHQLCSTSEMNKAYAERVLSVLNSLEDDSRNVETTENNNIEGPGTVQQENETPPHKYKRLANLMSGKRNSLRFEDIFSQTSCRSNIITPTTLPLEPQKKPPKSSSIAEQESDIIDFNNPAYNHFESSPSLNNNQNY